MKLISLTTLSFLILTNIAAAQGASLALGGGDHDATLPVEVTADNLSVDQASNSAVFSGQARVGQGNLRLGADSITVNYDQATSEISSVVASGSVVFTNGAESAEAGAATYTVATGLLIMTGNVLLLQGQNAFSGDMLTLDVLKNTANLNGNVKTVLIPK